MPILDATTMSTRHIGGTHYGFSATRIEDLGATEWTLVGIVTDVSGSVGRFRTPIENAIREIVSACALSPRADNTMLRLTTFNDKVSEIHGFRPLPQCQSDDYLGVIKTGGSTALYDAAHNVVESIRLYGQDLHDQDFESNAILFVITDGEDNASYLTAKHVREALEATVSSEVLSSMISVLIGVGVKDKTLSQYLQDLHKEAGFSQYIELGNASATTLAKLADFVSRSINIQSQALASGQVAPPLSLSI